jgi:hypothetical protein
MPEDIRYLIKPTSVTLPFTTFAPLLSVSTNAEQLYITDSANMFLFLLFTRPMFLSPLVTTPFKYKAYTVILF